MLFVKKLFVFSVPFWQKKSRQKRVSRHAPIWHLLTAHLPMGICCLDILTRPGHLLIHWSTKDIPPFLAFFAPPPSLCPLSIHSRLNHLRRKSYSPRPPFLKIFWSIFFCNTFKKSFVLWQNIFFSLWNLAQQWYYPLNRGSLFVFSMGGRE